MNKANIMLALQFKKVDSKYLGVTVCDFLMADNYCRTKEFECIAMETKNSNMLALSFCKVLF